MKLDTHAIKLNMAYKGLTASEVARLSGISRQSVCTILMRGTCSIVNAGRIANALNVPIEEIVKEG